MNHEPANALLTPAEVAQMFRVSPKTVTRWARAGRISAVRTLGGHRRFRADEIRRLLAQLEGNGNLEPGDGGASAAHP
jgi:excisionase family DNA binding protein